METLYAEISNVLEVMEQRSNSIGCEMSDSTDLKSHILELKVQLESERNDYIVSTLPALVLLSKHNRCYKLPYQRILESVCGKSNFN